MLRPVEGYLQAVLALSGRSDPTTARKDLPNIIQDNDLEVIFCLSVARLRSRAEQENVLLAILDTLSQDVAEKEGANSVSASSDNEIVATKTTGGVAKINGSPSPTTSSQEVRQPTPADPAHPQRSSVKRHRSPDEVSASKRHNSETQATDETLCLARFEVSERADLPSTSRGGMIDPNFAPADDEKMSGEQAIADGGGQGTQLTRMPTDRTESTQVRLYLRIVAANFGEHPSQRFESAADHPDLNAGLQRKFREDYLSDPGDKVSFQQIESH